MSLAVLGLGLPWPVLLCPSQPRRGYLVGKQIPSFDLKALPSTS